MIMLDVGSPCQKEFRYVYNQLLELLIRPIAHNLHSECTLFLEMCRLKYIFENRQQSL